MHVHGPGEWDACRWSHLAVCGRLLKWKGELEASKRENAVLREQQRIAHIRAVDSKKTILALQQQQQMQQRQHHAQEPSSTVEAPLSAAAPTHVAPWGLPSAGGLPVMQPLVPVQVLHPGYPYNPAAYQWNNWKGNHAGSGPVR